MATVASDLVLYGHDACAWCWRVRRTLDRLGVEVEHRDVRREPRHREELVAARGLRTVPVLRILRPEGDQWMAESADIIEYLEERFGRT